MGTLHGFNMRESREIIATDNAQFITERNNKNNNNKNIYGRGE